jgi:competence protein ComEA
MSSLPLLFLALAVAGSLARPALGSDACPSATGRPRAAPSRAVTAVSGDPEGPPGGGSPEAAEPAGAADRVDVNRASAEALQRLPGIGPRKASALVSARAVRPFRRASDLRRVKGFGARTVQRLAPLLRFD